MRRIRLGNLEIDRDRFEVHIEGKRVELTFLEFELLSYLAQHSRNVVPSDRLIEAAWGEGAVGNTGKLRIHISRLRKKVRRSEPWRIETVQKRGYVLTDASQPRRGKDRLGIARLGRQSLGGV